MPTYEFKNTETGEVFEEMMGISAKEEYLKNNPHIKQHFSSFPASIRGEKVKNDEGWKENLSRIAEAHPNSALAEKQGGRDTKTAKVGELAKKHGFGKKGKYNMDL